MLSSNQPPQLKQAMREHPLPLVFATISGTHLYGFASVNSDWDVRGMHVLSLREMLGLRVARQTVEFSHIPPPTRLVVPLEVEIELDLTTHDLHKFVTMLLRYNGYFLEQVLSPLVVHTTPQHETLRALARKSITRYHGQHYLGSSINQWRRLERDVNAGQMPRIKPLLYAFRTVLSGLHLMQTGEVETNLATLNASAHLPYIDDLMAQKIEGLDEETISDDNLLSRLGTPLEFYYTEHQRLLAQLSDDMQLSNLPYEVAEDIRVALSNWIVDTRLELGKDKPKPK